MNPMRPQSALRGTALLFSGRMVNRFLGLAREVLAASLFGAGRSMDAFNLAYTLAGTLRLALAEQLLTPTLPMYHQRRRAEGEDAALLSLRRLTTRLNLLALTAAAALFLFAGPLIRFLAPGFEADQVRLAATMTRWFAAGGVALLLHRFYSGLHLCFFRYTAIAYAPLLMNAGTIAVMLLLAASLGVISLAAGFTLGFLASWALLLVYLPHRKTILTPAWGRGDPGVKAYGIMLVPLLLAVGAEQVQMFVDRALASGLPAGALSAQGYALRLVRTSSDLWLGTFGTVVFPVFTALAARNRPMEFSRNFSLALQTILFFLAITGAAMVALALPTVRLLLERGAFTYQDSLLTARLLMYYTVAYLAQALWVVVLRGFNAHGDTRTPLYSTLIAVAVTIAADLLLVGPMGITGLALAQALGYTLNLVLAYLLFSPRLEGADVRQTVRMLLLALGLALPLGMAMRWGWNRMEPLGWVDGFLPRLAGVVLFASVAGLLYLAALRLLKVPALEFVLERLRRRRAQRRSGEEA